MHIAMFTPNAEYAQMCRWMAAAFARKQYSNLQSDSESLWADRNYPA